MALTVSKQPHPDSRLTDAVKAACVEVEPSLPDDVVVTNQTLTVASLVRFISLGGIAVRNGFLLVAHYVHLMKHEGEAFTEGWCRAAASNACRRC